MCALGARYLASDNKTIPVQTPHPMYNESSLAACAFRRRRKYLFIHIKIGVAFCDYHL